jgi:hypothetical protein
MSERKDFHAEAMPLSSMSQSNSIIRTARWQMPWEASAGCAGRLRNTVMGVGENSTFSKDNGV